MKRRLPIATLAIVLAMSSASLVCAQAEQAIAPLPKECAAAGALAPEASLLPNTATALRERKKITILAIGGTSASMRGAVSGGHYALVERFLETTFKGLDVEIVHRGVSGELAADAAERIKTEVALVGADLVLWQIGTADVLARLPVAEFHTTVSQAVAWLKEHNIDVILIGLRYSRSMAADPHYQVMRTTVQSIAKEQNVLRIGRYEAEETLEKIRALQGSQLSTIEATEASYACLAEYLSRAITAGLFVRAPRTQVPPRGKPP